MTFPSIQVPAFLRRDDVQRAVKAVLALGALGYLVYLVDPSEIASAMVGAHYGYVAAAVLLFPANALLEGASWRFILTAAVPGATWRQVYGAVFSGYALGLFTPARAGEFAGRALYFGHGDRWAIAATVFVQRLLDMLAALGCGTAALAWALSSGLLSGAAWQGALALGAAISLALALLVVWPQRAAGYARRLIPSERFRTHLDFLKHLSTARMAATGVLAGLRYLVYATQFVLLARAFVPGAAFSLLFGGVALVFFAKFLLPSLTIMDVGIREGAAVFFLSTQLGLPRAASFNAAFFLFLVNLVLPAAAGAPLLLRLRFEKDDDEAPPPSDDGVRHCNGTGNAGAERERADAPSLRS